MSFERNLLWSLLGRGSSALLNVLLIPVYIRFLGIEAWGLLGFMGAVLALTSLLEAGLSTGLSREFARDDGTPERAQILQDLARTSTAFYWMTGATIAAVVVASSGWIVSHWVQLESISPTIATRAVVVIGLGFAVGWPQVAHNAILLGRERQGLLNAIQLVTALSRAGLTLGAMHVLGATLPVYLAAQTVVAGISTAATSQVARHNLRASERPAEVHLRHLRPLRDFAPNIILMSLVTFSLVQADKLILGRMLPLGEFGAYMVAWSAANVLAVVTGPAYAAIFPRLTGVVANGTAAEQETTYERAAQYLALLTLPAASVGLVLAEPLLLMWTHDPALAAAARVPFSLLLGGNLLNAMCISIYALTLALNRMRANVVANTTASLIQIPVLILTVPFAGSAAPAAFWLVLNASYVLILVPFTHRMLGRPYSRQWFIWAAAGPAAVSFGSTVLVSSVLSGLPTILRAGLTYVVALALTATFLPHVRGLAISIARRRLASTPHQG